MPGAVWQSYALTSKPLTCIAQLFELPPKVLAAVRTPSAKVAPKPRLYAMSVIKALIASKSPQSIFSAITPSCEVSIANAIMLPNEIVSKPYSSAIRFKVAICLRLPKPMLEPSMTTFS